MTARLPGSDPGRSAAAPRGVVGTLLLGLSASGVLTGAALVDQVLIGSLETHLAEVYAPHGVPWQAAHAILMTCLLGLGAAGMVGWLATVHGAASRRRWAAPVGATLFLLGLGLSLTLVAAQEYGHTLVPPSLATLVVLPSVVGVVATALLWRHQRGGVARPAHGGAAQAEAWKAREL